jgi:cardiolipin synthase
LAEQSKRGDRSKLRRRRFWRRAPRTPGRPRRLSTGLRRQGLLPRPGVVARTLRGHNLRFLGGNEVDVYELGRSALAAMLESIDSARESIHLETYILRDDGTGRRFLDALAARARAGVSVCLLYDAFGSLGLGPEALSTLRAAGGIAVAFNPLGRLTPKWLPRRRDHRKLLVVDGDVGFMGGLNIGDEYWAARPGGPGWRDTQLRVRGPVVRDLEAVFLESWFRAGGPDLPWAKLLTTHPPHAGDVVCAVLPDGPVYRRRRTRDLVLEGLRAASQRVRLASPYFAPGRRVLAALGEAAARGVEVDLLVAGTPTDHPVLRRAARALYPPLLARGVRIHEYEGEMMHAKVGVFDRRFAIVGSSNLDRQSLGHSYEMNLVLRGDELIDRLDEGFERDVARARRVDATSLAARRAWERLLDALAASVLRLI